MHVFSPHAAPMPRRLLPAWAFSLVFHVGAFLAFAVSLERLPRGAADLPVRTAGIVLKRTSAQGALYEGEKHAVEVATTEQQSPPPETVATQSDEKAADEATGDQQPPATPTTAPGATSGNGQPNKQRAAGAAGLRGSSSGDNYAKVSVFGVEGTGNKFVYLFDRSASMEGPPLAAAKRQLIDSLQSLETTHQFHIIFFNHRLRSFDITAGGRRIAFATDRNKQLAANFVGGITADGGTDRFTALKQALAFRPDVVFFLTDADDPMSSSEMADIERIQARLGTAICVIEFGRNAAQPQRNFLTELARLSGGQYGYVNTAKLKP